jgi:hypothetical protein
MKIDLCLRREDDELPELALDASRYVVAGNGTFLERRTSMFVTSTRVSGTVPGLAEHFSSCHLACGKINRVMHGAMLGFFRQAHRLHGGEAALVLLYHVERQRFRWHCPEQTVELYQSGDRWWASDLIEFRHPQILPDGYLIFGDAHLHPGVAYPSSTDVDDDQDGLHIIVGNLRGQPHYHIDFVMDGTRFGVRENLVFEDPDCQPCLRPPRRWLDQIRVVARGSSGAAGSTTLPPGASA